MNKLIIAAILALCTATASAAGFQPWADRGVETPDAVQATVKVQSFYGAQLPQISDTPDSDQLSLTLVPWYLQGQDS